MSAHTPGPWHTGGISFPGTTRATQDVWGPTPEGVRSGRPIVALDVKPADARLIAAAPDLLAALVDLVEQGPCLHSAHDAACGVCCARAAIAKAVKP